MDGTVAASAETIEAKDILDHVLVEAGINPMSADLIVRSIDTLIDCRIADFLVMFADRVENAIGVRP